jgi:hypothetical protein
MIAVAASSTVTVGQGSASRWMVESVVGPGCTVVQNSVQSVPDLGAPVDLVHLYNAGAPTAATGANQAQNREPLYGHDECEAVRQRRHQSGAELADRDECMMMRLDRAPRWTRRLICESRRCRGAPGAAGTLYLMSGRQVLVPSDGLVAVSPEDSEPLLGIGWTLIKLENARHGV